MLSVDALVCPGVFSPKNTLLYTNNRGASTLVTLCIPEKLHSTEVRDTNNRS